MLDALRARLNQDEFAAANGIELVDVRPGHARMRMAIGRRHLNSLGLVHGGAMFTLAATTFFAACNASGNVAMGINMSIACLHPVVEGVLEAEATEISRSPHLAHCVVRVTDSQENLVAQFQGTAYVKNEPYVLDDASH
jgi:acyl-CoA thioesterase